MMSISEEMLGRIKHGHQWVTSSHDWMVVVEDQEALTNNFITMPIINNTASMLLHLLNYGHYNDSEGIWKSAGVWYG